MAIDPPSPSQQIAHFEARMQADPNSRAYLPLADLYRRDGKLLEAHQILVRGLTNDAACLSARVLLGVVLTDLGEHQAARRELQTVLDRDPDNLLALRIMGDEAAARADWTQAVELMERLLRLLPEDEDVCNALRDYRARCTAAVNDSTTQDEIPVVREVPHRHQPETGLQQPTQADIQPSDGRSPASLGVETPTLADLYRRQGHPEKARRIIDRIMAISPQLPDALAVLARLEQDAKDLAASEDIPEIGSSAALLEESAPEEIQPRGINKRGEDLMRFRHWLEREAGRQESRPPN